MSTGNFLWGNLMVPFAGENPTVNLKIFFLLNQPGAGQSPESFLNNSQSFQLILFPSPPTLEASLLLIFLPFIIVLILRFLHCPRRI